MGSRTVWGAIPMETVEVGDRELGGVRGGRPGLHAVRVSKRMNMKSLGELGAAESREGVSRLPAAPLAPFPHQSAKHVSLGLG